MKKRFSEEQITRILNEYKSSNADVVSRKYNVHINTIYKWNSKYGGMEVSDLRRLKQLETENSQLKKIVADQMLDITILKDVNSKKW